MNLISFVIFVVFSVLFVMSMPQVHVPPHLRILEKHEISDDRGQYILRYKSADGTIVMEQGRLKPNNDGTDCVLVKEGTNSYIAPDGTRKNLSYVADENGYQPIADYLPKGPTA